MADVPFSIGICAYNEGLAIEQSVRSIYEQKLDGFCLDKVYVISSASTDDTDDIVRSLMSEFLNLELIIQKKREGKNSAVNTFLDAKRTDIVVILNADNVLKEENSLQKLLEPFRDPKVGIVGGHPIPLNSKKTLAGFSSCMIWSLNHNIAMRYPKIGELIAYRDIGTRLPLQFQSDEDIIRMNIERTRLEARYAPEATVLNRGPETIDDLIKQRTRVNIGQSYMIATDDFYNPARDPKVLFSVFKDVVNDLGFHPFKMIAAVSIEVWCRIKAKRMIRKGRNDENIWDPVQSTKKI